MLACSTGWTADRRYRADGFGGAHSIAYCRPDSVSVTDTDVRQESFQLGDPGFDDVRMGTFYNLEIRQYLQLNDPEWKCQKIGICA
jgi:hypothetical protein